MLYLEHSFVRCWNLDTLESGSKIPWEFWNVGPDKDDIDQFDWLCKNEC